MVYIKSYRYITDKVAKKTSMYQRKLEPTLFFFYFYLNCYKNGGINFDSTIQ